jgi:hydrogenase expression/formation protein HypC
MCIAIPMQVLKAEPGHAQCRGRGETREVRTLLVGAVQPGEWLLVFIDSALQRLCAARAADIDATLDLLSSAMEGEGGHAPAHFDLPSQMSLDSLKTLSGQVHPESP